MQQSSIDFSVISHYYKIYIKVLDHLPAHNTLYTFITTHFKY